MNLIEQLQALQDEHGFLGDEERRALSQRTGTPLYEIEAVTSFYPHFRTEPPPLATVSICRDISCHMAGAGALLAETAALAGADSEVEPVSCLGRCEQAPACAINNIPVAASALREALQQPDPHPETEPAREMRTWSCDLYRDGAGRYGVARDYAGQADGIIPRLGDSGLRGRGGAAFPTSVKWQAVREQPDGPKYIICNADESEPGTFKDRVILEELPHLVIEGMVLAGLATGAEEGIVFIRHEYEAGLAAIRAAIGEAEASGALGENIFGSGRRFSVRVFVSPGGYIMGEETAMLEALEGRRGEPRNKPPLPVTHGLFGRPTVINNVETLAMVPYALREGRSDLKFFSVSGDVALPGVLEVDPARTSLRDLVELCGGMKDGVPLQAFLPGGASTAFLPGELADVHMDGDSLRAAGSSLGSGGVVVVGEGRDMLELARNLTAFFRNESCGKCVPCRVGTEKAVSLFDREGATALPLVSEMHGTLAATSICGLGQAALVAAVSVYERFSGRQPSETGT